MSYIGNTNTTQAFTAAVDYFNGNGSTVAFTLSRPVASVAQVQAVIENVPQNPGSAFTVSGNTITFTSAPPSGTSNIYVYYTSPITQVIAPSDGTVGTSALATGAVTTAKIADANVTAAKLASGAARSNFGAGAVLQVVQSTYSTFSQNSSATITDLGLSASITPSSTSNRVIVVVNICGIYSGVNSCYARFLIDRAGTSLINFGTASGYGTNSGVGGADSCFYLDSPATTSSVTYKVRWNREGTGTINMNNTVAGAPTAGTSTITLMEVAG